MRPSLLVLATFALSSFSVRSARADDASVVLPPAADETITLTSGHVVCRVTEYGGINAHDARTAADLICGELAERGSPPEPYEIRFGRLDGTVLQTVTRLDRKTSRRTMLAHLGEVAVAAPRVAQAILSDKSVAETEGADNVLSTDARRAVTKNGMTSAYFGLVGATTGGGGGPSGGFDVGIDYRLGAFAIGGHGRAGGIGSSDEKLGYASIDMGGRLHPWDAATAPFIGTGLVLGYFNASSRENNRSGSGLGTFAEVGVDMMRNARIGVRTSVRADLPFYALEDRYTVPLTFNLGLAFR